MKENSFPKGWDEKRVHQVISYYEEQPEAEAVAEDEAAYEQEGFCMVEIPTELLPAVRTMLLQHQTQK